MKVLLFVLLICINLAGSVTAFADGSAAINTMAIIMHSLNHSPCTESKKRLNMIVENKSTSTRERVLATAILNLNHKVNAGDAPALKKILGDNSAAKNERTLASIILNLNHMPAAAEKEALGKIIH